MSQAGANSVSSGGGGGGNVDFLEGNVGGPVGPNGANTIFVVGSGSISVSGNAGTNTLTISSSTGFSWQTISASQMLVPNNGYICVSPGGALSLLLPAAATVGSTVEITLDGATSFTVTQGAGQQIRIGNVQTTSGVGGSVSSTMQGDSLRMVCSVANLKWNVLSTIGNFTVV